MSPFLSLENVSKRYPSNWALSGVSSVFEGPGVFLILGANGAGKSTLMKICAKTISPDEGLVKYGSEKSKVRFFQHESGLYGELTVLENLNFFRKISNYSKKDLEEALEFWSLEGMQDRLVSDLSKGQTARVALARTFMGGRRHLSIG